MNNHFFFFPFLLQSNYATQRSYGKIQRATSFDSPEPKDATQHIKTDASNYLEPLSQHVPQYIEFLPDSRTQNYVYNAKGERVRDAEVMPENVTPPREPLYVQTTVKENFCPATAEYAKYLQQKCHVKEDSSEAYKKITHQTSSADSVIMKTIENIPSACVNENESVESSNNSCSDNNKPMDFSGVYSQAAQVNGRVPVRFRKHRLDSGNSVMSFDSVQTEPAYSEYNNHRNKLYSSSSSKSNYSVSNISECISEIPAMVLEQPSIDEENIQYWANNINNTPIKGQIEVKGHNDYLNLGRRSQVYPENLQTFNGYDIVQASLV